MFQPWFVELISVVSNVVVGLSALTVAIIAIVGLSQWKNELTGRTKYEIAKRMAINAFEFRDRYKRARSKSTFYGESFDRIKGEDESLQETNLRDQSFAYGMRLEPLQETLSKLYEASWEAEIILDDDIGKLVLPLEKGFWQLFSSQEDYLQLQLFMLNQSGTVDYDDELINTHYKVIYGTHTDDYSKEIDDATQTLVDKLKTYL